MFCKRNALQPRTRPVTPFTFMCELQEANIYISNVWMNYLTYRWKNLVNFAWLLVSCTANSILDRHKLSSRLSARCFFVDSFFRSVNTDYPGYKIDNAVTLTVKTSKCSANIYICMYVFSATFWKTRGSSYKSLSKKMWELFYQCKYFYHISQRKRYRLYGQ